MLSPSILGEVYITVPGEGTRAQPASVSIPAPEPKTPMSPVSNPTPTTSSKPPEASERSAIPFGKIAVGTVVLAILIGIGWKLKG